MLNQDQIRTLWPQMRVAIRNLWGGLTEKEIDQTDGDFSALASLVQEKYGEGRDGISQKIDQLLNSFDNETDLGRDPDTSSYKRSPNVDWNPIH